MMGRRGENESRRGAGAGLRRLMRRNGLHRARRSCGFTIAEVLMSLTAMGMIGVATASLVNAISYGTASDKDIRKLVVVSKTVSGRLNAAIRGSAMVLDQDTDFVVLWMFDTDGSGTPHLGEIRRINYDATNDRIVFFKAPDSLSAGDNTEYTLAEDFDTTLAALEGTADFPQTIWAENVSSGTFSIDTVAAQDAALVSYRFVIDAGDLNDTVIGAASPRN